MQCFIIRRHFLLFWDTFCEGQVLREAPTNWWAFLRNDENKTELFRFLSQLSLSLTKGNSTMLYTYDNVCQSNETTIDVQFLSPCNHEETDTRVFLHVKDMTRNSYKKFTIRTVDTDVLILAISFFHELKVDVDELWVDFGAGNKRCFFRVHEIYNQIGEERARSMPFFHAMTGCDQVSFLSQITKLSVWKVWELFDDVTTVLLKLWNQPSLNEVKDAMPILERFTVLLCSRSSNSLTTNECKRELFCQGRAIDNIPPTRAALWKHVFRAACYAGHVSSWSVLDGNSSNVTARGMGLEV